MTMKVKPQDLRFDRIQGKSWEYHKEQRLWIWAWITSAWMTFWSSETFNQGWKLRLGTFSWEQGKMTVKCPKNVQELSDPVDDHKVDDFSTPTFDYLAENPSTADSDYRLFLRNPIDRRLCRLFESRCKSRRQSSTFSNFEEFWLKYFALCQQSYF